MGQDLHRLCAKRDNTTLKKDENTIFQVEMRGKLNPGTKTFALTFDDGPHHVSLGKGINRTEKVLDTLAAEGIRGKGTFFVQTHAPLRGSTPVGARLIKRMFAEGYTVGIHTGGKKDHESGLDNLKSGSKGTFHPKTGTSKRIVVLYHDIRKGTANNIGAVIKHIKKRVPKAKFDKP